MAHNEARNIEAAIWCVLKQEWERPDQLQQVIVVSAASTDGTDSAVRALTKADQRVRLLALPVRKGKVLDVNEGLAWAEAETVVIMDADVLLTPRCLPSLLEALQDDTVGMAVPLRQVLNPRGGLMNRIGHLTAELQNATFRPKGGQAICIRRGLAHVAPSVPVDDAYQEWTVLMAGRQVRRVEHAAVLAIAPRSFFEFIAQRRRVVAQYLTLEQITSYRPVTRSASELLSALPRTRTVRGDLRLDVVVAAILIDSVARLLGWLDFHLWKRSYVTWCPAATTKTDG